MAWLILGIAPIALTVAAPYLAGFWDEFRDRLKKPKEPDGNGLTSSPEISKWR